MTEKKQPRGSAPRTQDEKIRLAHNIITSVLTASGAAGTVTGNPDVAGTPYRYSFYHPMSGAMPTGETPSTPGHWATTPWPGPQYQPQAFGPTMPAPTMMYGPGTTMLPTMSMPAPGSPWYVRRPF